MYKIKENVGKNYFNDVKIIVLVKVNFERCVICFYNFKL